MRKGRSSPACSARSQPVLRATPDNKPSRKAPAVARVSALPNTGPIRSLSAISSRSQATSEPDQTATDIDAPPLPDSPRRRPYRQYRCNCSSRADSTQVNSYPQWAEVVSALGRAEALQERADGCPEDLTGPGRRFAHERLELGEELLDWVEVRRVGRQIEDAGPHGLDRLAHSRILVSGVVVHHHDVAHLEFRGKHPPHVGPEPLTRHGSIQHERRNHPARPQARHKG